MLRRVCWLWATPTLIMHTIPLILQAHGMQKGPWYAKPGPWGMPYLRPPRIATLQKLPFFFFLHTAYLTLLYWYCRSLALRYMIPPPRFRGDHTISRFNPTLHYPIQPHATAKLCVVKLGQLYYIKFCTGFIKQSCFIKRPSIKMEP